MDSPRLEYLGRDEAAALLGVKPATLYAYVSRGLIRSLPAEDSKRSLYARADIERLRLRKRERPSRAVLSETSSGWGTPILRSNLTRMSDTGPVYRGQSCSVLVRERFSFEAVADLLLTGTLPHKSQRWPPGAAGPRARALIDGDLRASARREIAKSLAALVLLLDIGEAGSVEGAADPRSAARYLIQTVAGCFCWIGDRPFAPRRPREGLAAYALRSAGSAATPRATRALEAALIALADNALAPATYAALVLASTGVGLNAGISAALSSNETTGLGQVFQVGEKMALELMNRDIQSERVIREYAGRLLANQRNKRGDGRVRIILAAARSLGGAAFSEAFVRLERIRSLTGVHANLNVALGLLALALGLPARSTPMIWTLGRMAGWCSHIIEQSGQGAGEAA